MHTVEGFGTVNKAEMDVFLELSCLFNDPADIANLTSGSSAFSKTSWKPPLLIAYLCQAQRSSLQSDPLTYVSWGSEEGRCCNSILQRRHPRLSEVGTCPCSHSLQEAEQDWNPGGLS